MVSNPPGGADDEGNLDKVNLAEVPLSLEVLADLHAGVYDTGDSNVLRQRADQDPDARQTLAALDQVRAELVAWMDSPAPEVPESVVDDIVAALRAESAKSTLPAIAADAVRPADVSLNLVTGPVPLDHRRRPAAKRRWLAYSGAVRQPPPALPSPSPSSLRTTSAPRKPPPPWLARRCPNRLRPRQPHRWRQNCPRVAQWVKRRFPSPEMR